MSFDRVAETYDETRGGDARAVWIASDLVPLVRDRGTVLEIGIGTGAIAAAVAGHSKVVGIDLGFAMLKRAYTRIGARVAQGDATSLPIRTESVDAAYSVWLLHLVDPGAVLAEVARVLKPGARYVVSRGQRREPTDVEEVEERMFRALRASERRLEPTLEDIARGANLTVGDRFLGGPMRYGVTPLKAADRIEQRARSALWDVDYETWRRVVEPALAEIRALPEPSERRFSITRAEFVVLERDVT